MYRTKTTVSMGLLELTELTTYTMVLAEHMETMELMPKTTAKTEHIIDDGARDAVASQDGADGDDGFDG